MLWAVIMAGGSGTRFWPESREDQPKQFLSIFGKKTLLEQTMVRLRGVIPKSRIIVVTQADKVSFIHKKYKLPKKQIIGEPVGRNTAPCAALAATLAYKQDKNAVIALLPADHRIEREARFKKLLKEASVVTTNLGAPVTFGIKPTSPHTGYGYLESSKLELKKGGFSIYRLKQFHEKPKLKLAKQFVKSKKFLWNSGMFVWAAKDLLEATKKHLPKAYRLSKEIVKGNLDKNMKAQFKKMPNISIDFGLMEKLKGQILTVPVDLGWNDLGGWLSFEKLWKKDFGKNALEGEVLLIESKRNIVKSSKNRMVALLGVEDLVVVDTEDALLVCPKAKAEQVRKVVDQLKKGKLRKYL